MELLEVWLVTQPFCTSRSCNPRFRELASFQSTSLIYVLFRFKVSIDHCSTGFRSFLEVVLLVGDRLLIISAIILDHFRYH